MTTETLFSSLSAEQTSAVNTLLINQRDALTAVHVANLAEAVANDQAQLAALSEKDAEIARLTLLVPIEIIDLKAQAQAEYEAAQKALTDAQEKLAAINQE